MLVVPGLSVLFLGPPFRALLFGVLFCPVGSVRSLIAFLRRVCCVLFFFSRPSYCFRIRCLVWASLLVLFRTFLAPRSFCFSFFGFLCRVCLVHGASSFLCVIRVMLGSRRTTLLFLCASYVLCPLVSVTSGTSSCLASRHGRILSSPHLSAFGPCFSCSGFPLCPPCPTGGVRFSQASLAA